MFEALLQRILNRLFGQFIQGIDSKKLNLGIWSGKLVIENVRLRKQLFDLLGLPYEIAFSIIQKIIVVVPWKSLSSKPVQIVLDSMLALIISKEKQGWRMKDNKDVELILNDLNGYMNKYLKRLIDNEKNVATPEEKQKGYFDNTYIRALDNIQFSIRNIHLRFEDNITKQYSFGLTLESIEVFTCNQLGQKAFLDRTSVQRCRDSLIKSVELNNLGLYWRELETNFLHQKAEPTATTNFLFETIFRKNKETEFSYLFMINSRSLLKQRSDDDLSGPRYQVSFQLQELRVKLSKTVVQQIISLVEFKSEYFQRSQSSIKAAITPRFRHLLSKYYLHYESDQPDLNQSQKSEFGHILLTLTSQQIKQATEQVVKEQYKNKIITKMIKKKKNMLLDETDISQIDGFMEKLARPLTEQKPLPNDYIYFHLGVNFSELSMFIVDDNKRSLFSITLFKILSNIRLSNNQQKYNFEIEDIKSQGRDRKDILWKDPGKKFLVAEVIQKNSGQEIAILKVSSVQFLYDIRTIQQLKDFTQVKVKPSLKNRAIDKVQEIGSEVQKNIQSKRGIQLHVTIDAPKVLLLEGRRRWVVQFGNVILHKEGAEIKAQLTDMKTECQLQSKIFQCIPVFSVDIDSKGNKLNVSVSELQLSLDKVHYKSLISLFSVLKSNTSKADIMTKSSRRSLVFLRQKNWKKVLATICEGYLYFWEKKDFPLASVRIRKVLINTDVNRSNTLSISDQKGTSFVVGFEDPAVMNQWLEELQQIANIKVQQVDNKIQSQKTIQVKNDFQMSLIVKSVQVVLKHPDLTQWLRIQVTRIKVIQLQSSKGSVLSAAVADIGICVDEFKCLKKLSDQEFLLFQSNSFSQSDPSYQKKDSSTKVTIRSTQINYDPNLVIRLFAFLETEEQTLPPAEKMYDQETMQKMSQQRLLSHTEIVCQGFDFILINKKTNLPLARMSIRKLEILMLGYYYESVIEGSLEDMSILDLTNYPKTIYEESRILPVPRLIWGSVNLQENEKMLTFKYVSLQNGSKKVVDNHFLLLTIRIFKAHLLYLHEPVLRIVDYLKVQLKGALSNPQFFDEYHGPGVTKKKLTDYKEFIQKKQETIYNRLLTWLGKERVRKSLELPREMYMNINLIEPQLAMMSNNDEGLKFKINKIEINNEFYYSADRVISGPIKQVLCERYKFFFEEITLEMVKGAVEITEQPFNINLSLDMFFKEAQYRFISNEPLNLDCSETIKMFVTPLYFSLSRQGYLQILKVVKLNISHEDGLDFLMIHDYLAPEPSAITVQLDFQSIVLSIKDQEVSMVQFNLEFFRYSYKKSIAQEKQTVMNVASIQAKYLIDEVYKQIISRRRNLKMSTSRRNLSMSMYKSSSIFEVPRRQVPREVCLFYRVNSSKYEEITKIILSETVFIFEIEFLLFLKKWSVLPPIQPIQKVYTKIIDKSPSTVDLHMHQNSLSIRLSKDIISFYIPRSEKMFNMSLSLIYTENSARQQIVSAEQAELFFCNVNDISLENFSSIKKKTFMGNCNFRLRRMVTNASADISLNMSKIIIKFSLKDIRALSIFLEDVSGKFSRLNDKPQAIKPIQQPTVSSTNVVVSSQSFEILLINDTANRYFPIIYFNLECMEDFKTTLTDTIDIDIGLRIFVRYFNLKISIWEPLIEHCQLKLKSRIDRKQPGNSFFEIKQVGQKQNYVTIDISTNFIETVIKTSNDMELEFRSFDQSDQMNDSINTCIVTNYTGYEFECSCGEKPVRVDRDCKKELKIKSGRQQQQTIIERSTMDVFIDVEIPATNVAIRKINIKSEYVQKIPIRDQKRPTFLVKVVKVDISKNIKYIMLVSPVILVNSTCIDMAIRIQSIAEEIPFLSGTTISMPYDNFDAPIQILYQRSASDPINTSQTIKLSRINVGNYRLNVKQIQKEMSRRIIFESPYKITSILPLPLFMNFKIAERCYSLSFAPFDPKTVVTLTYFESIEDSVVSMYVETKDMLWTQFLPLQQGPRVLEDMFGNSLTINVKKIHIEQENTENYIIYPTVVFLNKSQENIVFYNQNKVMLAGQKFHTENRSVLCSELNSIILSGEGNDMYTPVMKLPKQAIEFLMKLSKQIDGSMTKVNCLMSLRRSVIQIFDIKFTKYILKSQYTLHNNSNAELLVRHANAFMTETTKLSGNSKENMYWFSEEFEKAIRITINASNWQWSSPLNIDRAELTHFILRDRSNFRKVLFMTIQVNLVQEQRQINLKILNNQEEYPFLLINESPDVNILVPSFKMTLNNGNQMYFSWDDPYKQLYQVEIIIQPANKDNSFKQRVVFMKEKKVQNQIIDIKAAKGLIRIEIDVVTRFSQKIFRFKNYVPAQSIKIEMTRYQISLPIAVCLINNSGLKANNTLSLYTNLNFTYLTSPETDHREFDLTCNQLQVDNNTKLYVYYPVVLKSNFHIKGSGKKQTWLQMEVDVGKIILRIQEDFVYQVYSVMLLLQSFVPPGPKQSTFSISRIKLPKLDIQLQVQAKKLSIQTPIELDQPPQSSYPWDTLPYPIKDIVLSLLSNLSVSPLSFIASLHEGVVGLFNDTNSSRGVEGFFTKIIQSIGNGINGMVRILVGDMERIDTFVDGVQSGVSTCLRTTLSSLTTLYYEPDPIGFFKTIAGFVYKPITGVLQLTLKITEGIKNTTKFKFEIEDFETRRRYPVIFWGNEHYYIEYDGSNSEIILMLQSFQGGKYKEIDLVEVVYLRENQQENSVILLSTTFLLHISLQTKKCFWAIPINVIDHVKLREQIQAIQLFLKSDLNYFSTRTPTILIQDVKLARKLAQSIDQLLRQQRITN